jgi:glyoxylase-like metal-dependent hydrolase (beta-lactamase superfamily II)
MHDVPLALPPFTLHELPNQGWDSRVRVFRVPDEVDVTAIICRRLVLLVDTGPAPACAREVLKRLAPELAGRPLLVVNTHADYDHCWGNAALDPSPAKSRVAATIIAHAVAGRRLRSAAEGAYLARRQARDSRFAAVRLVAPLLEIESQARIDGGDLSIDLLPTPGHSPDHLALWLPAIRTLLAGDAAEFPFPCCGQDSDSAMLVASLRRLQALQPQVVIPCHGGPTDATLLDKNVAYFALLEARLRAVPRAALAAEADASAWLGYSFEDAVRDQGGRPEAVQSFYRTWHDLAIRSVLRRLQAESGASA